jgi:hypothetical protein
MAPERFQKRMYLRQLRAMRDDFRGWATLYREAADTTNAEWLQGRFLDRAAQLQQLAALLSDAFDDLEQLARLS